MMEYTPEQLKEMPRWKRWRILNRDRHLEQQRERKRKDYHADNSTQKRWVKENKDRTLAHSRKSYVLHRDKRLAAQRDSKKKDYYSVDSYIKRYNEENKERISANRRARENNRRIEDPAFKIVKNLRRRLNWVLHRQMAGKHSSTMELLGCSMGRFMEYIHAHFTEGMTWNNYGAWHLDHRKPCDSFDLTDPDQQEECFSWLNLQPLWATDNISKGCRLA